MLTMEDSKVLVLQKRRGETPLECIARYREKHPRAGGVSMTHVGRMEPLTEGVMLVLLGEENNHRSNYAALADEYLIDVLFGFSTDTFDLLGKIVAFEPAVSISAREIGRTLNEFRGRIKQQEPQVASRTMLGKSIVEWSKIFRPSGLPEHEALVYEIALQKIYKAPEAAVLAWALEGVEGVIGDFRQEDVRYLYKRYFSESGARKFSCATIRVLCSPETSARSIADGVGEELGVPSVALRIVRTKVGDFASPERSARAS